MNPIQQMVREHQAATDTSDKEMLAILCEYLGSGLYPNVEALGLFIVERLERGPMDIPVAPWRTPFFTEAERSQMLEMTMEEVRDSTRYYAEQVLDDADVVECIGYAVPDNMDHDELCRMLSHIGNPEETYLNGEFLREHDDDGDNYAGQLDWCKRMGLINEEETELTERGREFISRFE